MDSDEDIAYMAGMERGKEKARTELLRLEAELEQCKKDAGEWQPIEAAPKDGFHILLYKPEIIYVGFWGGHYWCANAKGVPVIDSPTHWMPLPEHPK